MDEGSRRASTASSRCASRATLPAALRGTLYRNGPGQFGQFGKRYAHPFEGDGAITAIRIADGRALGASRVTASAGLVEERAAGKLLYGTTAPWPRKMSNMLRGRHKNLANTSVVMWQGRLFALVEASKPTELAPDDLAMIGETDLGVIHGAFSAHPHRVAARKAIYNFGIEYGRHTKLSLYELPDVGAIAPARRGRAARRGDAARLHRDRDATSCSSCRRCGSTCRARCSSSATSSSCSAGSPSTAPR